MRVRPMGWELTTLLLVVVLIVAGWVVEAPILITASLLICAIAAPIVVLSFLIRLVVAVIDRYRDSPARPKGFFVAR